MTNNDWFAEQLASMGTVIPLKPQPASEGEQSPGGTVDSKDLPGMWDGSDLSGGMADSRHPSMELSENKIREVVQDAIGFEWAADELQTVNGHDLMNVAKAIASAAVAECRRDAERLDWLDANGFTAYRRIDPIDGLEDHCVVVHEGQKPRRGNVADTIREAIDAAMREAGR